ncbi:glycine zipper 2TM protein [Pseudoduganella lurida]|jgi:outer membrane lipoprotein SlyB|uniref:Glycine zipper 2TM protein n=1 Tax=Pseudoduganella lurida TaxID=1036180 RepID=A0A562R8G3_9BURK|nr:glycine zipper 2TM domain-containing protein [Pseudoduganella lurida]TWI65335.1 glycine zipper 2TM protein [Pseudoduganella lurida]
MNARATLTSLALATTLSTTLMAGAQAAPNHRNVCNDCGKVTSVRVVQEDGHGNAGGAIVGGLAGGLLGNQVGSGGGRTLATVAGAVGGAYAGKHVQGKMNKVQVWNVNVHFNNGRNQTYRFEHNPDLRKGDRVRKDHGTIVRG